MKIALVNGSPKARNSGSAVLLEGLADCLPKKSTLYRCSLRSWRPAQEELEALAEQDILVFAAPLYVDGLPGHFVSCLTDLEKALRAVPDRSRTAYAMVNCGFYEGEQTHIALEMMEHWARRAGVRWGQGLGVGAGGMLAGLNLPMGKGPWKDLGRALEALAAHAALSLEGETAFVTANFPRAAYKLAAEHGWRSQVKANGLRTKDLFLQK